MRSAARPAHRASSSRHRLEHAGEAFGARPRHHRAAMRPRLDQSARREQADRLAHRRARDREAARQLCLVERSAGRKRAAHDLVGELQRAAPRPASCGRRRSSRLRAAGSVRRRVMLASAGSSIRLTCAATTRQPSRKAHPGLHLAADLAGHAVALEQRRGDREVAAVGGDHGARVVRARPTGERAARNGCDLVVAVEVLADAVADGARVVAEDARRASRRRWSPAPSRSARTPRVTSATTSGRSISIVVPPYSRRPRRGARRPSVSSAWAMRSAMSSRHGAAMICTPIGSGSSGTGTATTGRPMNEIGWV